MTKFCLVRRFFLFFSVGGGTLVENTVRRIESTNSHVGYYSPIGALPALLRLEIASCLD